MSLLFFLVTWPLEPISKGTHTAVHPCLFMSFVRSKYLEDFLTFALSIFFSKLTVISRSAISFSFLLIKTMSGLWPVVMMSAGIVPPLIERPGISV